MMKDGVFSDMNRVSPRQREAFLEICVVIFVDYQL